MCRLVVLLLSFFCVYLCLFLSERDEMHLILEFALCTKNAIMSKILRSVMIILEILL